MVRRGVVIVSVIILLIGCNVFPVTSQSISSSTDEFILDSSLGNYVYSMVIDDQNQLLLVGARVPTSSNDTFRVEGMLLKVTDEGEVSEVFIMDYNEVNSLTDIAIDMNGNIILAGKGGEREGNQFGYVMKLSSQGEIIWSVTFPEIYFQDYVGIEVNRTSNEVYFAGSVSYGQDGVFLSKINETGYVEWEQIWVHHGYLDIPYSTHSLYLTSSGLLLGVDMGETSQHPFFLAEKTVAFSSNGTELWEYGEGLEILHEVNNSHFLCTGEESVALCDSDLEIMWETELDLHCDYRPRISGFTINSSGSMIVYGSVIGLGESPIKSDFSLAYTPALIPQTLIASTNETGGVEWYDFYISGTESRPCGASFDQDERLVIAGYSEVPSPYSEENFIWILWDFVPTPFPDFIICDEQPIYFGLSLIPVTIILSWGLYRAKRGRLTEDLSLTKTINIFRKGGILCAILFFVFFGILATPFPSPMNTISFYVLIISLLFFVTSYIMEYLAKRGKEEPEYEPIYHYYQQQS